MANYYKDFYWITPDGKVLRPKDEEFHYEIILSNPKIFGYKSREEALKFKDSHGGDADALRIPAIAQGFVRIRMRGGGLCIIQTVKFDDQIRKILKNFFKKEDVFKNLTYELKNVGAEIVLSGRVVDFFDEKDIPSYDKNSFPAPRDNKEGREQARKALFDINFDDTEKYKQLAIGNFEFKKNIATVKEFADIDLEGVKFSDIVVL